MADLTHILQNFNPNTLIGRAAYTTSEPPRIAAIKEMQSYGLKPPSNIPEIGQIFRFPDATDKGQKKSAWGIYYEFITDDSIVATCVFGSYKGDPEKVIWSNKRTDYMTTAELREFNQRTQAAAEAAQFQRELEQAEAAKECAAIWEKLPNVVKTAYTERKLIKPYGGRVYNDALCVPVYVDGVISSLQYIADDGAKRFHPCGKIKGGYLKLEGGNHDITYITEGYATGCSIHQATGADVYVCFNAGNIFEFCSWLKPRIVGKVIIAADDDYKTAGNPGITKAKTAADAHGFDIIAPVFKDGRGTDFNDLHKLEGIEKVSEQLKPAIKTPKQKRKQDEIINIDSVPEGVIGDIYRFYMATSGTHQPGFAIQTALAIVSSMCGRYFITDCDNCASIYFLNIGKTATGKEHIKRTIETVMAACNMDHRIAGDGFTSSAAVISLMMQKPACIVTADEFGKYLEASNNASFGMQKEANTALMELIGRLNGTLRAKSYSTMTLNKDQIEAMKDRLVHCPALTLVGLTTPSTFFANVKAENILDGFLNRFLVHVSDAPRQLRKRVSMMDVPQSITKWADVIKARIRMKNPLEMAQERPVQDIVAFTDQAFALQQKFEQEMLDLQDELEKSGMEGLAARANEWSMRLALCVALSRDPHTTAIHDIDVAWCTNYMRQSVQRMIKEVRQCMHGSDFEAQKMEILGSLRKFKDGLRFSDMQKTKPFSAYTRKQLMEILATLREAELIDAVEDRGKGGRPTTLYKALD